MRHVLTLLLCGSLLLGGCAGRPVQGRYTLVEESAGKPGWLNRGQYDEGDNLYFVGSVESVQDRSLGIEEAEYDAKKRLATSLQERVKTLFESAMTGSNRADSTLGKATQSAVMAVSKVDIRGVLPVERYWRKMERVVDDMAAYSYDVHVLVKISKIDYQRALHQVVDATAQDDQIAADNEAKALLERVRQQPMD